MVKAVKKPLPREDRGGRYVFVLELSTRDHDLLNTLVQSYQKSLGAGWKANKAFVLRQLIRCGAEWKKTPPVIDD